MFINTVILLIDFGELGAGVVTSQLFQQSSSKAMLYITRQDMNQQKLSEMLKRAQEFNYKAIIINIKSTTVDDLTWLVNTSQLPTFVKGVTSTEAALRCLQCKAHGVVVSNEYGDHELNAPVRLFLMFLFRFLEQTFFLILVPFQYFFNIGNHEDLINFM